VILGRETCRAIAAAGAARIDLDELTVTFAGGVSEFEVDEEVRHRLLHGHDEIAITLKRDAEIGAYEAANPALGRATTSL
jgi:3-isopropylmalate/(R)-2-methylmalate dehydratase small subunit